MKIFNLHTVQKLPITIDEAWDFFSNPENLKTITPDYMSFDILAGGGRPMYPGQLIQYKVTPIAGIPTKWVTEITHIKEKEYFVDEQRFGPYNFWHHKHFISSIPGGVKMEDVIDYKLPFGKLGELFHPVLVEPKLKEIFKYRKLKLEALFGIYSSINSPEAFFKRE